jgi:flagellin
MSLSINTNLSALQAEYYLNQTDNQYSQSIQRLSSGLKINSAADDPSGLILSENLKAQIASISQATTNDQTAVNYAKTADSALGEVNSLLSSARSLAVAAGNSSTLTSSQLEADQTQLNSIVSSIAQIASTTNYAGKNLLDGSAGVNAQVTNGADFQGMSFSGSFDSVALTTASAVTVDITQAATQAEVKGSQSYAGTTSLVTAGTFSINGTNFTTTSTETVGDMIAAINGQTATTGVTAAWDSTTDGVDLTASNYGSAGAVNLTDSTGGILLSSAGISTSVGKDIEATVSVNLTGKASGVESVNFTGGKVGMNAFTLADNAGNTITVTSSGNATGTVVAGYIGVGSTSFQIGSNAGDTASLSLGNFNPADLGTGVVSGLNMSNLDITSASGATNALKVIDAAISQVSTSRGQIGSFETNTIDPYESYLGVASQNLSATESDVTDTDVASEMTTYSSLQVLQESGISMLGQANSSAQMILKLIENG